ncbi:cell adhesion molecule Dscam2-like isoform X2 [Uloborus diversus]|uniref:cell adhesion molecule Dscam2-like isoform X2 n=1 Tax=Uloborus diversus TaxID=327109 RepID=UPI0024096F78|nr:cell adhesion molecule Dscam2-like isoform X2 [Uloborus diversus]
MPVTTYNIRILAENSLGQSKPSEPITVTTNEEAPAAPPSDIRVEATSSTSIKVSWMAPPKEMRRGSIKGYYLGYKIFRSADTYTYKTLESSGDVREEHHLTNLRRFTQYVIRLQAFNKAGSGPHSEEISVETLEYDPPGTPVLRVISVGATSVKLEWKTPDSTPVQGYLMQYREDKSDWIEHRLPPDITNHVLQPLRCGTRYQVQMTSFNKAGNGEPSDVIQLKTEGTAPVAPDRHSFLSINSTFATLRLDAWHSGGCQISYFEVKYKLLSDVEWFLVSNNVLPETGKLLLSELTPGTWYNLMISAQNDAGSTDAEYVFATLTIFGGTVAPPTTVISPDRRFFKHLSIIVPVVCAVVIVIVVTIVICVLHTRRNPPNNGRGHYDQADGQSRTSHKGDTLNMSVLGKKGHGETAYEVPKDSLYFPSPYATTRVPGYVVEEGSECDSLRNSRNSIRKSSGYNFHPYQQQPTSMKLLVKCCDREKLVSRWIGRPASEPCTFELSQEYQRRMQEESRWYPARYRTTLSTYPQEQRLECSDDENDFESLRMLPQDDDEEGPEISETEADRELKIFRKPKGNSSLCVAMPPECQQAALTALAVH